MDIKENFNLCDFHTHLHQYDINDKNLSQIKEYSILTIAASMDIASYINTKKIKEKLNTTLIIPTFGIHPSFSDKSFDENLALSLMDESPIIGEIGLDYLWAKNIDKKKQIKVFRFFLDYCNKTNKYCVIHTKDAEKDVIDILKDYPNARPIIHWYDGPTDIFEEIINRGYYCTFGCEVKYSSHIRKLLSMMDLNKLLLETDNPESEIWLGGKRQDPLLIDEVETDVAKALNRTKEEIKKIVLQNSFSIISKLNTFSKKN